jgi:hypothetical protein
MPITDGILEGFLYFKLKNYFRNPLICFSIKSKMLNFISRQTVYKRHREKDITKRHKAVTALNSV